MSKISRSEYQRVVEENKKLLSDIRSIVMGNIGESVIVKVRYRKQFEAEAEFSKMMKAYATQYFKDHPEEDISHKINPQPIKRK